MAHARKQIRDAAVIVLTGLPSTGTQVFGNKFYNLSRSVNKALRVYPQSESDAVADMGKLRDRSLVLVVEAVVRASSSSIEDEVDQVCAEVEAALDGATLVNSATVAANVGTNIRFDGDGGKPVAEAEMLFQINYTTRVGQPEVIL